MISKYTIIRPIATLNDYLETLPNANVMYGQYEKLPLLRVNILPKEHLDDVFGKGIARTMCTGLNASMDRVLNNGGEIYVKEYTYRPSKEIFTVICETGWAWDARAFSAPETFSRGYRIENLIIT